MIAFTHDSHAQRVVFASGALERVAEELERFGLKRALVLCTPGRGETARRVRELLGAGRTTLFERAQQHVRREIVDEALALAVRTPADCCLAIGGGSATGLAKAVALETGIPVVALPTTYAGSEMTPVWGVTDAGKKTTGRDARVLPRLVIYDPELTLSFPPRASAASAMNAIAHCVEALYAPDGNAATLRFAEDGLAALGRAIPRIIAAPGDGEARAEALYGAYLAGKALAATSMGLHHQLCHVLGGRLDLPHAETHAVMLPCVTAFNTPAAPGAAAIVARTLAARSQDVDAAGAIAAIARGGELPHSLRELGVGVNDLPAVAESVAAAPYPNPRPVTEENVLALLRVAHAGRLADVAAIA